MTSKWRNLSMAHWHVYEAEFPAFTCSSQNQKWKPASALRAQTGGRSSPCCILFKAPLWSIRSGPWKVRDLLGAVVIVSKRALLCGLGIPSEHTSTPAGGAPGRQGRAHSHHMEGDPSRWHQWLPKATWLEMLWHSISSTLPLLPLPRELQMLVAALRDLLAWPYT